MTSTLERRAPWILVALCVVAGTFYAVAAREGSVHGYYTTAVIAMSQNAHAFVFGAVDSSAWAGVDKIPGTLWPGALSVALFGSSAWAVLIPGALAAVATIVVLYLAVARWLGKSAGLVAAALYATTPLVAAVAQVNVPETWFEFPLALAAYFAIRAAQSGRIWWLIGSGLAIAAAFQMKMLQAWTFWPAVILVYLVSAPGGAWRRIWHLLVAGAVSVAASLWWVILVTLTPSDARPWVGGSDGNSPWEMVFGYNGLGRFGLWSGRSFVVPMGGDPGVARLLGPQIAVDVAWLLPLAVIGLTAGIALRWRAPRTDVQRAGWLMFGAWLLAMATPILAAEGIHTFYVLAFAPALAALAAGAAFLGYRGLSVDRARERWLVIAVLVLQVAWTSWIVLRAGERTWVAGVTVGVGVAAIALALAHRPAPAIAIALGAVMLAPVVWSIGTLGATESVNPTSSSQQGMGGPGAGQPGEPPDGGPPPGGMPNGGPRPGGPSGGAAGDAQGTQDAVGLQFASWMAAHDPGATYLVAAESRMANVLTRDGTRGVVSMGGGFDGSDPTPTANELSALVASGALAYVIETSGDGGGGPGPSGPGDAPQGGPSQQSTGAGRAVAQERAAWIAAHCAQVADAPTGILQCRS